MEPIATLITTLLGSFVGVLLGVHLGRRFYGLTTKWEGWDKEIEFLMRAFRR